MIEHSTREIIKENLRNLIVESGITPVELSKKAGVSFPAVYDWLKGKKSPTLDTIDKLSTALGCQRSDLLIEHSNREDQSENRFYGKRMSDDEMILLEAYRRMDGKEKIEVIRDMTNRLANQGN